MPLKDWLNFTVGCEAGRDRRAAKHFHCRQARKYYSGLQLIAAL